MFFQKNYTYVLMQHTDEGDLAQNAALGSTHCLDKNFPIPIMRFWNTHKTHEIH